MTSLDEALTAHADAKAEQRESPNDPEVRQAYAAAAQELRYQRWLARGGPADVEADLAAQAADDPEAVATPAKAVTALYERWLAEGEG